LGADSSDALAAIETGGGATSVALTEAEDADGATVGAGAFIGGGTTGPEL
jgi:hypothetical protein